MNLVRSLSPSFSMSLAGTVLCVLVVTTPLTDKPSHGQTRRLPTAGAIRRNNSNYKPRSTTANPRAAWSVRAKPKTESLADVGELHKILLKVVRIIAATTSTPRKAQAPNVHTEVLSKTVFNGKN